MSIDGYVVTTRGGAYAAVGIDVKVLPTHIVQGAHVSVDDLATTHGVYAAEDDDMPLEDKDTAVEDKDDTPVEDEDDMSVEDEDDLPGLVSHSH